MLFVWEDIPAKLIASKTPPVEGLYLEVKLRNQNWLIGCSYSANKPLISQHVETIAKNMDLYSSTYENFIFLADLNAGMEHFGFEGHLQFIFLYKTICWKSPSKPTCNDMILTNRPEFHKMVVTIMKTTFGKFKPKIINYRKYKNFSNDIFRDTL